MLFRFPAELNVGHISADTLWKLLSVDLKDHLEGKFIILKKKDTHPSEPGPECRKFLNRRVSSVHLNVNKCLSFVLRPCSNSNRTS